MTSLTHEGAQAPRFSPSGVARRLFIRFGILPWLLLAVVVFFGLQEPRFLSEVNLLNVARQSTFLMIVAMAQLLVLITAGMDLSVGAMIGLVGVIAASVMKSLVGEGMDVSAAIALGMLAGLGASVLVGAFNGFCVAVLRLSPFIATLGTMTALTGIALTLSNGVPVSGFPQAYLMLFSVTDVLGMKPPILATIVVFILGYVLLHHTTTGRYMYAIGSNERAARLSGISTTRVVFTAYILCSLITGVAALLVLARTGTGGAGIGADYGLQSVTACVIAGVSLFGGTGKIGNVVLGALFLALLSNGMNIMQVQSYAQMVVLGAILVLALVGDRLRMRLLGQRAGH